MVLALMAVVVATLAPVAAAPVGAGVDNAAQAAIPTTWSTVVRANDKVTCAVSRQGRAWCWGTEDGGELGDGGPLQGKAASPVPVAGAARYTRLVAGDFASRQRAVVCGLTAQDEVWCWGSNGFGGVGIGSGLNGISTPHQLAGQWSFLAPGETSCGIQVDGSGWCWGRGDEGQVGDGGMTDRDLPVQVPGSWLSLKSYHATTCGIQADGSGWCWGRNNYGQVGIGNRQDQPSPVQLSGSWSTLNPSITSCGVRPDSTGWCWGYNEIGAMGVGDGDRHLVPTQLVGSWSRFYIGAARTCGQRVDGSTWCWGDNRFGELGDGTRRQTYSPVALPGSWTFLRIEQHACGLQSDGSAWCWGFNENGEVGTGSTKPKVLQPNRVAGTWTRIVSRGGIYSGFGNCGIRSNGTLWCWGRHIQGQAGVGDGQPDYLTTPQQVLSG